MFDDVLVMDNAGDVQWMDRCDVLLLVLLSTYSFFLFAHLSFIKQVFCGGSAVRCRKIGTTRQLCKYNYEAVFYPVFA